MKDNEIYDILQVMAADADKNQKSINDLQEVVERLEKQQSELKAAQEKFYDGLDERISAAVYLGVDKGLDESKDSITKHTRWCQQINRSIIEQRKEISTEADEVDSKAHKAVIRVEVVGIILMLCIAALYAVLWFSIDAVQTSFDSANQVVQQAADYISQVNARLDLALKDPVQTPYPVPESVKTLSAVAGIGLLGFVIFCIVKFFKGLKKH